MNTKDFIRLGIPLGAATRRATDFVSQFILSGGDKTKLEEELKAIVANPAFFAEDPLRKELAKAIVNAPPPPRTEPVKYRQWGEGLEHEAVMQMEKACLLPVAVADRRRPQHIDSGRWNAQPDGPAIRLPGQLLYASDPAHGTIGGTGIAASWILPRRWWAVPCSDRARKETVAA